MDFSEIFAALTSAPVVLALIAAGALLAAVDFAVWVTNAVATFFDEQDAPDPDDSAEYNSDDVIDSDLYECEECGAVMDYDTAIYSMDMGHCYKCGVDLGED